MKMKCLAIGIILLFIGIAVAPSINFTVVKASNDNDLVEVTAQACGIKGYGNTTVKLTRQQYQNLEKYLIDFRARLNQTTTKEEAVPIFKEAVVELNNYGLLPKGMNITQVQKLVIDRFQNDRLKILSEKLAHNNRGTKIINNTLCLIAGDIEYGYFWSLFTVIPFLIALPLLTIYIMMRLGRLPGSNPFLLVSLPFLAFWAYGALIKPINLISVITIGPAAAGSVYTVGLLGIKNIYGNITGAVTGFTGIRIVKVTSNNNPPACDLNFGSFFIGTALQVILGSYWDK
jgi:hypothetical protein